MQVQGTLPADRYQILSGFRNAIEINSRMSDEDWQRIADKAIFMKAGRKSVILKNGSVEHSVRYLLSGILKIVFHDSDPYVFDFRGCGDFLCDTQSLLTQNKSVFSFETVSPCEWIEFESADFLELIHSSEVLYTCVIRKIAEYAQRAHERGTSIRSCDAEERYTRFCRSNPGVVKVAKIGDVASFLNITPQSLSRIRRQVRM